MEKCPRCGADPYGCGFYKCGSMDKGFDDELTAEYVSNNCLLRQLAQSDEKRAELKTEYDLLFGQLAAANERAGRLEKALRDAIEHVAGSRIGHYGDHTAHCDITVRPERLTAWVKALEVPDALLRNL